MCTVYCVQCLNFLHFFDCFDFFVNVTCLSEDVTLLFCMSVDVVVLFVDIRLMTLACPRLCRRIAFYAVEESEWFCIREEADCVSISLCKDVCSSSNLYSSVIFLMKIGVNLMCVLYYVLDVQVCIHIRVVLRVFRKFLQLLF